MSRDSNTDKGCSGEWAAQPACFIWNGRIRQTTVPWVDVSANQCFILLFIAFHGLRGKLKVVSILKRSQKSKTGFLLFLGGSGGRSESLFCLYNGCSSGQWQIWLSTWASAALGGREQGLVLLNSSFTKVIFICQAELQELEEIDSLCLRPFNQKRIPAENRQWSRGAGVGVGRGGTDRPAAHNWFPKGKPRRGMAPWGSCHVNTPRGDYWKDLCMKGGRWRCLRAFASGRNPLLSKSHPYSPWLCTTFSPWKSNLPIVRVEAFKLIQLNKSAQRSALGWININPPPSSSVLLSPLWGHQVPLWVNGQGLLCFFVTGHSSHFGWKCSLKRRDVFLRVWPAIEKRSFYTWPAAGAPSLGTVEKRSHCDLFSCAHCLHDTEEHRVEEMNVFTRSSH